MTTANRPKHCGRWRCRKGIQIDQKAAGCLCACGACYRAKRENATEIRRANAESIKRFTDGFIKARSQEGTTTK